MNKRAPACVGQRTMDIETPALILELDAFEHNLSSMAAEAKRLGVSLRPHAKAHKCGEIARLQQEAGAVGICCQKVSEAEAMAQAGVTDIYLSNQVVAPVKLDRLAALARTARISLAVDSVIGVREAARAAADAGVSISLLIEVDLGDRRAGVQPGPDVLALAKHILSSHRLRFAGLQAYRAEAQHAHTADERRELTASAAETLWKVRANLLAADIPCPVVSGGGTGTYRYAAESGVYSEIQPGSYIFMDAAYSALEDESGAPFSAFQPALFVDSTVTSATQGRAMCDAGAKAIGSGRIPKVVDPEGVHYHLADDEHGRLRWTPDTRGVAIGERLRLHPDNCDPTVNLHDWILGVRNGRVEEIWPVDARGPGL